MTRNVPPAAQMPRGTFVRSEVRPATFDGLSMQPGVDRGLLRSQASRESLKRSRVIHATGDDYYNNHHHHHHHQPRPSSPAKYQRLNTTSTSFVRSPVTSATPLDDTAPHHYKNNNNISFRHNRSNSSSSSSSSSEHHRYSPPPYLRYTTNQNPRDRKLQRSPIVSVTNMTQHEPFSYESALPYRPNSTATGNSRYGGSSNVSGSSRAGRDASSSFDPAAYTRPYINFMTENPTVFHAVDTFGKRLEAHGYKHLSERDEWSLIAGGKYYITRNGSGLIAFSVGSSWKPGDKAAVIACHVDALTAKVKPISNKPTDEGYLRLGVAHYGGALSNLWIDRDLSIGGRVFVKDAKSGKIASKLVKLPHPVAKIPSIAPHFGIPPSGQENRETRMVPIIGLDNSDIGASQITEKLASQGTPPKDSDAGYGFGFSAFASTQPPRLVKAIARELAISPSDIVNWELEMYSSEPATELGLDKEFISAGRIDDKLCSWAAIEALVASQGSDNTLNVVGLFDDEEVGSLLRQGANSNFLPGTVERIAEAFGGTSSSAKRTFAKSFMISADVCHAYNPNYSDVYLAQHAPRLNVGVGISFDSNAHMSTDGVSSTILSAVAERSGSTLQPFQIRNDSRSGGTVGPMLSSATGMRAVDAGIPQLAMHSIRATTGSLDPGLGVKLFKGLFDHYDAVDQEVQQE